MITCEDFPFICRICMGTGELQLLSELNTINILKSLITIDINDENLPKNICRQCIEQLDNIYKFVEHSNNCNRILETLVNRGSFINITNYDNYIYSNKENNDIEKEIQTRLHLPESLNDKMEQSNELEKTSSNNDKIIFKFYGLNCSECGKVCSSKCSLAAHMMSHRKDQIYQCMECSQKFPYAEYLRRHTLNAHGTKPFICIICQEGFIRKRSLDEHMHSHTGETPYICSHCGQTFKVSRHFNKHMYLFHNPNLSRIPKSKRKYIEKRVNLKLECKDCDKIFASRSGYANHQLIHRGIKNFLCNICGKQFLANAQLQLHLKRHRGDKPFICTENDCDKTFTHKERLLVHLSNHPSKDIDNNFHYDILYKTENDVKNFSSHIELLKCSYCNKTFNKKPNLQTHIQRHLKLFKCNACSKTFQFASYLNTHMRVHNGEKPYMCSECGKLFSQKQTLTVHMRIHLGITPFECSQCDKKYHDSTNLKRHHKRHHE